MRSKLTALGFYILCLRAFYRTPGPLSRSVLINSRSRVGSCNKVQVLRWDFSLRFNIE
jgi:hypothetical protein